MEKLNKDYPLFIESLLNHQKLINILVEYRDGNNISRISQPKMAILMDRSQTWVAQAIKRINTEDVCIEFRGAEQYIVHYDNLLTRGVFSEIMRLMIILYETPDMFHEKDSDLACKYNLKLKSIQMFKAYLRTGWKKSNSV